MSDWKYIDEYDSLPDADFIHCDTRDFHIKCTDNEKPREETVSLLRKAFSIHILTECLFAKKDILRILKELETKTGGKKPWRHITSDSFGWLKYIRFVKFNSDDYLAYRMNNDKYSPIFFEELVNYGKYNIRDANS